MTVKLTSGNNNAEFHERCVASADICWCEVKNVWLPETEESVVTWNRRKCAYLKQKKVWLPETEEIPASTGKNGEGVLCNLVNKIVKSVLW